MNTITNKLSTMLAIQDDLNRKVHPEWRRQYYPWNNAVWTEAAELFDHLPWKWWKKSTKDVDWGQVRMEAVDIWHFVMSAVLQNYPDHRVAAEILTPRARDLESALECLRQTEGTFKKNVEEDLENVLNYVQYETSALAHAAANPELEGPIPQYVWTFFRVLEVLDMDLDELYRLYVGKTKLNQLRWENGYGTTYIKMWGDQEDNQFLTSLLARLDSSNSGFPDHVYEGLLEKYQAVVASMVQA